MMWNGNETIEMFCDMKTGESWFLSDSTFSRHNFSNAKCLHSKKIKQRERRRNFSCGNKTEKSYDQRVGGLSEWNFDNSFMVVCRWNISVIFLMSRLQINFKKKKTIANKLMMLNFNCWDSNPNKSLLRFL